MGCGSSDSRPAATCDGPSCYPPGYTSECGEGGCWQPTDADTAFADEFCALTADCCVHVHAASGPVPTAADHVASCSENLLRWSFSRDAAVRAACLDEVRQLASSSECLPELFTASGACSRLVAEPAGRVRPGGDCKEDGDCMGEPTTVTQCWLSLDRHRRCHQTTLGKAGDACIASIGLDTIEPVLTTSVEGHYCPRNEGLICRPLDDTPSGHRCIPVIADGEPCLYDYDCATHNCPDPDSVSDAADDVRRCVAPSPSNLPNGATCGASRNCASGECFSGICMAAAQLESFLHFCRAY